MARKRDEWKKGQERLLRSETSRAEAQADRRRRRLFNASRGRSSRNR